MAAATFLPDTPAFTHTDAFSAAVAEDTFLIACELADSLEIMQQCYARNVPLSDDFLGYVDDLTERIQEMQPSHKISVA